MLQISQWDGDGLWNFLAFLNSRDALINGSIYRGHSDAAWKLIPALYRRKSRMLVAGPLSEAYLVRENLSLDAFFNRASNLLDPNARSPVRDRIIAQHYGVPTQLLDWTRDVIVATYFATDWERNNADGAIYQVNVSNLFVNYSAITFPIEYTIAALQPPTLDERVRMQKSVFTIQSFGTEESFVPLDDRIKPRDSGVASRERYKGEVESFNKIIIPYKKKLRLREDLLSIGVDSSLLFPGLQGIGLRIAEEESNATESILRYEAEGGAAAHSLWVSDGTGESILLKGD